MKNQNLLDLNFDIWLLIAELRHKMVLVRQKELNQYRTVSSHITNLRFIEALGANATISAVAKVAERKYDVIARQAFMMEKDGLINRIKNRPKSRLLKLEFTEKGREMLKISKHSEGMNEVLSILTEDELQQLHSVLKRLLININEYIPKHNTERLF